MNSRQFKKEKAERHNNERARMLTKKLTVNKLTNGV